MSISLLRHALATLAYRGGKAVRLAGLDRGGGYRQGRSQREVFAGKQLGIGLLPLADLKIQLLLATQDSSQCTVANATFFCRWAEYEPAQAVSAPADNLAPVPPHPCRVEARIPAQGHPNRGPI